MTLFRPCYCVLENITFQNVSSHLSPLLSQRSFPQVFRLHKTSGVRGFKDRRKGSLTPSLNSGNETSLQLKSLVKPLLFTVGVSTTSFVGCTIWQYENFRSRTIDFGTRISFPASWFPKQSKSGEWRQKCNDFWNKLTEGQKLFAPVLFMNVLVYAAWRVPRFQPTMMKYFASNPAAKVLCWPMLLSTFSHYSFLHLAANMFVLHSFSPSVVNTLGKEQTVVLYLAAGVISSFTSYLYKVIIATPGLSLGASGAIMGILGYVCTAYPDARLSIILLPMFTFSAGTAIKFVVGMDLMGCIMGWKFFDHAAHLGGAVTGICWGYWGNAYLWPKREPIIRAWHKLRESSE